MTATSPQLTAASPARNRPALVSNPTTPGRPRLVSIRPPFIRMRCLQILPDSAQQPSRGQAPNLRHLASQRRTRQKVHRTPTMFLAVRQGEGDRVGRSRGPCGGGGSERSSEGSEHHGGRGR